MENILNSSEDNTKIEKALKENQEMSLKVLEILNQSGEKLSVIKHILFVDDEEDLLFSQGQMLKLQGYNVTSTTSSMEALDMFQKNPYYFDLLITDQTMPDITGIEIIKKILHIRPDMPVILCTGYSEQSIEDDVASLGIKSLLIKPVTAKNLAKIIKNVLE